jgi:hypothetical protein
LFNPFKKISVPFGERRRENPAPVKGIKSPVREESMSVGDRL